MPARPIRVGTDYSGMETPILALRGLGVAVRHIFSSEIDSQARTVISEKFGPELLFDDAVGRSSKLLPEKLDLYVAGFPCQMFSQMRNVRSAKRATARSKSEKKASRSEDRLVHFYACLRAIKRCRPRVFVLENVPRFATFDNGGALREVQARLRGLGDYHVSTHLLDARNYGNPQMRRRFFLVGLRKDSARAPLEDPPHVLPRVSFAQLLSSGKKSSPNRRRDGHAIPRPLAPPTIRNLHKCLSTVDDGRGDFFMEMSWGLRHCNVAKEPPTLLAHSTGGLYSSLLGRRTTLREDMLLQGIPRDFFFPESLSEKAGRRMVGNAMCVDVMRHLLRACLSAARIVT